MIRMLYIVICSIVALSSCNSDLDEYEVEQTGELSRKDIMQTLGLNIYKLRYKVPDHEKFNLIYIVDLYVHGNDNAVTEELGKSLSHDDMNNGSFVIKLPSPSDHSLSINGIQRLSDDLFEDIPPQARYGIHYLSEKKKFVFEKDLIVGICFWGTFGTKKSPSLQDFKNNLNLDIVLSKILETDYHKILVAKVRFERIE